MFGSLQDEIKIARRGTTCRKNPSQLSNGSASDPLWLGIIRGNQPVLIQEILQYENNRH